MAVPCSWSSLELSLLPPFQCEVKTSDQACRGWGVGAGGGEASSRTPASLATGASAVLRFIAAAARVLGSAELKLKHHLNA